MRKTTSLLMVLFLAFMITATAQEKKDEKAKPNVSVKFGKGLTVTSAKKDFGITFRGRFQSIMQLEHNADADKAAFGASIKRARLKVSGFAFEGKKLEYFVQLAFTNGDISTDQADGLLYDAYFRYNVNKKFNILFGQMKLPGNREFMMSSQKQQFVDRSETSGLRLDRDVGIHLNGVLGEKVVFKPTIAITLGEGRNYSEIEAGGLAYTFKAELLPLGDFTKKGEYFGSDLSREESPKLALSAVYDLNHNAKFSRGHYGGNAIASDNRTSIHTIFADVFFKYKGISIFTEYARKMVKDEHLADYQTGNAVTASAGYVFKKKWEVAARYSRMMPLNNLDVDKDFRAGKNNYTVAVSKYFIGHNLKIQTDYTIIDLMNNTSPIDGMWRFQVEVAF